MAGLKHQLYPMARSTGEVRVLSMPGSVLLRTDAAFVGLPPQERGWTPADIEGFVTSFEQFGGHLPASTALVDLMGWQ